MQMDFMQFMLLAGITAFTLICFMMCCITLTRVQKMSKKVHEEDDIIEEIRAYYEKIKHLGSQSDSGLKIPENKNSLCKMAVVHFNAFPDVTGAVSFCLTLLNRENTGIILTSIYGRDSSNTYIRDVKNGECSITLLPEEAQALEEAVKQAAE